MYRQDHIKVLKVFAADLPKRPSCTTKDVVERGFKRAENGDRRVRNAYRKLRSAGLIEICDRGAYRLTPAGGAFCKKAAKASWKLDKINEKKAAPKKAAKKTTKKAAPKKAAKKATKKTAKKAAPKKAKARPKTKAKAKSAKKQPAKAAPSKGNGVGTNSAPEEDSSNAQLSF
jgi:restriction endonuclease Mrr